MKPLALLFIATLLSMQDVAAQLPADQKAELDRRLSITFRAVEALGEGRLHTAENCDSTQARVPYPYAYKKALNQPLQEETREAVITITGWTGGCKDGKRDGHGELAWRVEKKEDQVIVSEHREEGRMVAGRPFGMWCTRHFNISFDGKPFNTVDLVGSCHLWVGKFDQKTSTGAYRKLPDGRWQLWGGMGPAEPASYLAAGELEARSEKIIASAATGDTNVRVEVRLETRALDDLVRGAKITLAPDPGAVSLKDKRVAVVLSSQTISEIERFRRERQVLIDGTLGMSGDAAKIRARFITASNPDRILESIAKLLRGHTREVVPVDSLAGMSAAELDYALVLDWKSFTRMDLLGKYDEFPIGKVGDARNALSGYQLSAFVVSPDLRAVRQYTGSPFTTPKFAGGSGVYLAGDSGYLFRLANHFESMWGKAADDAGTMVTGLRSFLERN